MNSVVDIGGYVYAALQIITRYLHNANKCCLRLQLFVKFFISDMGTLL